MKVEMAGQLADIANERQVRFFQFSSIGQGLGLDLSKTFFVGFKKKF